MCLRLARRAPRSATSRSDARRGPDAEASCRRIGSHDYHRRPLYGSVRVISTTEYTPLASTYVGTLGTYTPEQLRLRRERRRAQLRRQRRRRRLGSLGALLAALMAGSAVMLLSGHTSLARARAHPRSSFERATLSTGAEPTDALPFPPNPDDRIPRPGEVPSLYADGLPCSTGCRPVGADLGWPIKPFRREHGIRAGINELRPGSLHVALDIQARDGTPVYAVQPGVAKVLASSGPNARVQVGNYIYWHITPTVETGELVQPFKTVLGNVMFDYGHLAFSEVDSAGDYVNPLRPGGIVLSPYINHAPPEIATPSVATGGQVVVAAYSPQSFVQSTSYPTPVLAPAGLAWRLYSLGGEALTPLEWSYRERTSYRLPSAS